MSTSTSPIKNVTALVMMLLGGFALGQSVAIRTGAATAQVTMYEPVVTLVYSNGSLVTSPVSEGELSVKNCMAWRQQAQAVATQVEAVVRANFECRRVDVAWHRAAEIAEKKDAVASTF